MKQFLTVCCIAIFASCSNPQPSERVNGYSEKSKTPEDSVMHELMEAHDGAMEKTGRLNYLKAQIDSLSKTNLPAAKKEHLKLLKSKLDTADTRMEKWMTEFDFDKAQKKGPGRMPYLINEKDKVSNARDLMLKNVTEVDSALKKL